MGEIDKPLVVVGVVIKKDGKYLFVQEKKPETYGLWNLPAGRKEIGETVEETAARETKEETGYDIKILRKIKVFQKEDYWPVYVFEAVVMGGELTYPADEILDAKWFTIEEISAMGDKLRHFDWILESINLAESKNKK